MSGTSFLKVHDSLCTVQQRYLPVRYTGSQTCLLDLSAPHNVVETKDITWLDIHPLGGTTHPSVLPNGSVSRSQRGAFGRIAEAGSEFSVLQNLSTLQRNGIM